MRANELQMSLRSVFRGPVGLGVACVLLPMCASAAAMLLPLAPRPMAPAASDRGGLAFDQYLVNLGEVPPEPLVFARFEFTNRSNESIVIDRLEPSCGCLQPKLFGGRRTLAPGERGGFLLQVRTFGEAPGPHEYYCDVHYRDRQARTTRVYFRVRLPEKTIQVRPRALIVYQSSDEPTTHTVSIENLTATPLQIVGVRGNKPWLDAEPLARDAPQPTGDGMTSEPAAASGVPAASARRLQPVPEGIGKGDDSGELHRDEQFHLDAQSGSARQSIRITISAVPPGVHDGIVIIETSHPQFRRLSVPVRVYGPRDRAAPNGAGAAGSRHQP